MKALIVVAMFIILMSVSASAADWTRDDTYVQLAAVAVMVADWGQTRYISRNPQSFQEFNPILGKHPSTESVDAYFASAIVIHTAIAYALPKKTKLFNYEVSPRRIWQYVSIGYEAATVVNNAHFGIKLEF